MRSTRTYDVLVALRQNGATGRNELRGILQFLSQGHRWNLILPQTNEQLNEVLRSRDYDGAIIGALHDKESLHLVARSEAPTVLLDLSSDAVNHRKRNIFHIQNHDVEIGKLAGVFLTSLGTFKSYAYIPTNEAYNWSRLRGKAFAGYLERKKISCQTMTATDNLASFLSKLPKPAAVFCAWDGRARDVIATAKTTRVKIPSALSVLGVDNDEIICENLNPALSSVRPNHLRIGLMAAECLNRLFKKSGTRSGNRILMRVAPVEVVERESTCHTTPAATLIARAEEYVREHASEPLTPDGLAAVLHVSRRLLFLRFKEYSKVSVAELIRDTRLNKLKELLLQRPSRPIALVTRGLGYVNDRQIKNLFRKRFGMTMRDWRKAHGLKMPQSPG